MMKGRPSIWFFYIPSLMPLHWFVLWSCVVNDLSHLFSTFCHSAVLACGQELLCLFVGHCWNWDNLDKLVQFSAQTHTFVPVDLAEVAEVIWKRDSTTTEITTAAAVATTTVASTTTAISTAAATSTAATTTFATATHYT